MENETIESMCRNYYWYSDLKNYEGYEDEEGYEIHKE